MIGVGIGPTWGSQAQQYYQRVLATGPIAYWPLWEPSGSTITDLVAGNNGVTGGATPPTFGSTGIGDGRTSLRFPGLTAVGNVFSASLAAAVNGAEGSLVLRAKVTDAGVLTDATTRNLFRLSADTTNYLRIVRTTTNNQYRADYDAGSTLKNPVFTSASTGWQSFAVTWSKSANELKVYLDGSQVGTTQTALGNWAGAPTLVTIGAYDLTGASAYSGTIAHVGLWTRALSPAEVAAIGSPL